MEASTDDTDQSAAIHEKAHQLRKHLKKMRYLSEFAAPLYSKKKSKRWLKRITKTQRALGEYLDHQQYQHYYQQKSHTDTQALYGAGWFAAQLEPDTKRCKKRLTKLQDAANFW